MVFPGVKKGGARAAALYGAGLDQPSAPIASLNPIARPAAALALLAALAACGDDRAPAGPTNPAEVEAAEAGYLAPPRVTGAQASEGALVLHGRAPAGDRVRLTAASGGVYGMEADGEGVWRLRLPRGPQPQLYTLEAERQERVLQAEGRLLLLPDGRSLMLRPGHGALPIGPGGRGAPRIFSIDVAVDGAAAVSGFAQPSARVVTVVDGAPPAEDVVVGQGATDADGRFAIILAQPLRPGPHVIVVNTPDGVAEARLEVQDPLDPGAAPFAAEQAGRGWRISWRLPRGGVQSTYVLGAPA